MRRIRSTRPRKRPGHYAFASALQHSIEVSHLTCIRPRERRMHGSFGRPQFL